MNETNHLKEHHNNYFEMKSNSHHLEKEQSQHSQNYQKQQKCEDEKAVAEVGRRQKGQQEKP